FGDAGASLAELDEKIDKQPTASAYVARGMIRLKGRQLDEAITDFSEALRVDPKSAPAYEARAVALSFKDEKDRAVEDISAAIALDPQAARFDFRAGLYARLRQDEKAIEDFGESMRLNPKSAAARFRRAPFWLP